MLPDTRLMTKQEIFDTVALHLLTQKEKSITSTDGCVYFGPNNLRCAIGVLLLEHPRLYNANYSVESLLHIFPALLPTITNLRKTYVKAFYQDLQNIHDSHPPKNWRALLQTFAQNRKLSTKILSQETTP